MDCYDMTAAEHKAANKLNPVTTTPAELVAALRSLGLRPGCQVVVHSAFSSLGTFEGGPEALCRTLMDAVTPEGTLIMPALSKYPADGDDCVFNPASSPVRVGIVPDTFRKLPGVLRSWDPTHSFCAWGKDKLRFVENHHRIPTMDKASPLGLLEQAGGYCLMIGCYAAVTFMHVVETSFGARCTAERAELYDAVINGVPLKLRGWAWRDGPCSARNDAVLYSRLRADGALAETMLHRCHLSFFRLADYRTAFEQLLRDPEKGCAACHVRPRRVDRSVPSDWDAVNRRIVGDEPNLPYTP